jgi:quercetin dioxygenase-like cupin family protein
MDEFAILKGANKVVFEDDEIAVTGMIGSVALTCPQGGTTFVVVAEGGAHIDSDHRITSGMYACVPNLRQIVGQHCLGLAVTVKGYNGIFQLGGPIETKGRLKYIDGCTDTGLIQPPKLGDPCLNALFFPPGINQTRHYHPSHRVGLVYDGEGLCHTDNRPPTPMRPGDLFLIKKGGWHAFETKERGMRIVAFHPDSDFGPSDESHQMLDATLTRQAAE